MRLTSIILVALAIAATLLFTPPRAVATNNFIKFLAAKACSGEPAPYKSGCYGYLEYRCLACKGSGDALSNCKRKCDGWYTDSKQNEKCKEGCQYIKDKD
jgi:hypothetical protein